MKELSEDILVLAAEGNIESFEMIYKAYSGFVHNVAYRVANNREDAQEVTQEVFLTIYRKIKDFRFESSFETWVYRITVNSAINYLKKMSKERNKMVSYRDDLKQVDDSNQIKKSMDKEHQERIINSLLSALNPDQRMCIILRNIEGLSYEGIAETLKININTVRSRIKRARETMLALKKEVVTHEL